MLLLLAAGAGRPKKKKAATAEAEAKAAKAAVGDADDEEEDDGSFESAQEEEEEHSKPSAEDRPAKTAARKKVFEEEFSENFTTMSIKSSSAPYGMEFKVPYLRYDYLEEGRKVVSVDFLVPNQHRRFFD